MEEQKARLEDQRGRLEAELREQFRRDITALRGEMAEVSRQKASPPPPPQPAAVPVTIPPQPALVPPLQEQRAVVKRRDSGEMLRQMEAMKDALKADFQEQIKVEWSCKFLALCVKCVEISFIELMGVQFELSINYCSIF